MLMEKTTPIYLRIGRRHFAFFTHTKCYHGNHSFRQNVPFKKKTQSSKEKPCKTCTRIPAQSHRILVIVFVWDFLQDFCNRSKPTVQPGIFQKITQYCKYILEYEILHGLKNIKCCGIFVHDKQKLIHSRQPTTYNVK